MNRGMYGKVKELEDYSNSEKMWHIELLRVTSLWYEFMMNDDWVEAKEQIVQGLKAYRATIDETCEKRFIYFIGTRKKVRFDTEYVPTLENGILKMQIEIGVEKNKKEISLKLSDHFERVDAASVSFYEKMIIIDFDEDDSATIGVCDFVSMSGCDLDVSTNIHYVGLTKNPESRPISGQHRGLTKTLYENSSAEHDIFIFYNLFRVYSVSDDPKSNNYYTFANSMIDEVNVEDEGRIIEKLLILYFTPPSQRGNLKNEVGELKSKLLTLTTKYKINKINFSYELEERGGKMFCFGSSDIKSSFTHQFKCELSGGKILLSKGFFPVHGLEGEG